MNITTLPAAGSPAAVTADLTRGLRALADFLDGHNELCDYVQFTSVRVLIPLDWATDHPARTVDLFAEAAGHDAIQTNPSTGTRYSGLDLTFSDRARLHVYRRNSGQGTADLHLDLDDTLLGALAARARHSKADAR
jgi:hypothetical protein